MNNGGESNLQQLMGDKNNVGQMKQMFGQPIQLMNMFKFQEECSLNNVMDPIEDLQLDDSEVPKFTPDLLREEMN